MLLNIILITSVFCVVAGRVITENKGDPLIIEVPEECKGKGGCMTIPKDYDKIIARIDELLPEFLKQNYSDRIGEEIKPPEIFYKDDVNNCAYEVSEQPYSFYNGFFLARSRYYKQYIETVRCLNSKYTAGEQCYRDVILHNEIGDHNQNYLQSSCELIYRQYTLYIYDYVNNEVVPKVFEIPACCSCVVNIVY